MTAPCHRVRVKLEFVLDYATELEDVTSAGLGPLSESLIQAAVLETRVKDRAELPGILPGAELVVVLEPEAAPVQASPARARPKLVVVDGNRAAPGARNKRSSR